MRSPATFLAAGMLALSGLAQAGAGPADLLVKMSEAARTANYQGVIVYRGDEMLETMRVTHRFQNGVERERVQSLTGEPREILKQDSRVICLLPKNRKQTMERPTPKGLFPGLSRERVQRISQVYVLDDLGTERVAGRSCRGVAIKPRDNFRYGYEIWADAETLVPLKVNLIGRDKVLLEQMMFTEVEFPSAIPDSAFQTNLDPAKYREVTRRVAEPAAPPAALAWRFDGLPAGYQVTMRDVRASPSGKGTVEHLLLSDGLSAISIFSARKAAPSKGFRGVSQMGAVHAYGRMLGTYHITVVGEAPPETVQMIGDAMKPVSEATAVNEGGSP